MKQFTDIARWGTLKRITRYMTREGPWARWMRKRYGKGIHQIPSTRVGFSRAWNVMVAMWPSVQLLFTRREGEARLKDAKMNLWDITRQRKDMDKVFGVIWFKECIPRWSCCLFRALNSNLHTRDRTYGWYRDNETKFVLCNEEMETHNHLFVTCCFAARLWTAVEGKFKVTIQGDSLDGMVRKASKIRNEGKRKLTIIIIAAMCYYIWRARNKGVHGGNEANFKRVLDNIVRMVSSNAKIHVNICKAIG